MLCNALMVHSHAAHEAFEEEDIHYEDDEDDDDKDEKKEDEHENPCQNRRKFSRELWNSLPMASPSALKSIQKLSHKVTATLYTRFGAESYSLPLKLFLAANCTCWHLRAVGFEPVLGPLWHSHSGLVGGLVAPLVPTVASAVQAFNSPQVTLMPKFQLRCRVLQLTPQTLFGGKLHLLAPSCRWF